MNLFSAPKPSPPPAPPPARADVPEEKPDDETRDRTRARRRRRGYGTVATSLRGILAAAAASPRRKSLLGE